MKVAIVASHVAVGGADKIVAKQAEILRNFGHDVVVIATHTLGWREFGDVEASPSMAQYLNQIGIRVLAAFCHSMVPPRGPKEVLPSFLKREAPDLIILHNVMIKDILTEIGYKGKLMLRVHGDLQDKSRFPWRVVEHYGESLDLLVVPHRDAYKLLSQRMVPCHVSENPIDEAFFKRPPKRASENVIGYCGRISKEKSLVSLAGIAKLVQDKVPDVKVRIVGDADPEYEACLEYKKRVVEAFAEAGVPLQITGFKSFVADLIQEFRVSAMLSVTEGFCNFVWESAALEVPIVSTDVGAANFVVPKKFLVPMKWNGKTYEIPTSKWAGIAKKLTNHLQNDAIVHYGRSSAYSAMPSLYEQRLMLLVSKVLETPLQ